MEWQNNATFVFSPVFFLLRNSVCSVLLCNLFLFLFFSFKSKDPADYNPKMSNTVTTEDVEMASEDEKQTQEEELLHKNKDLPIPSPNQQVEMLKRKYGGLLPKKPPLISKDHEHAFFDSADWALGKQGGSQKAKGPLEALRPKLEPTPHHHARSRRSTYAHASDDQDAANPIGNEAPEDDHACVDEADRKVAVRTEGEGIHCDHRENP